MSSRIVRCPHCGKDSVYSTENPNRPFCSERCRLIDIGDWASENYRVPVTDLSSQQEALAQLEVELEEKEKKES